MILRETERVGRTKKYKIQANKIHVKEANIEIIK